MIPFEQAIRKDLTAGDVHMDTAMGNGAKPGRLARWKAERVKKFDAGQKRELTPLDDETSHVPFPFEHAALGQIRPDQTPRFLGVLTNPELLPLKTVSLDGLTAMQNRVSTGKVKALTESGGGKPPVVVRMNGKDYIADGHHRLAAAWVNGEKEMEVRYKDLEPVNNMMKAVEVNVAKSNPTGSELWAWASVAEVDGKPVIDSQGDIIAPAELEKAADDFMTHSRDVGLMHDTTGHGRVVQSMVFTKELQAALGIDLGRVGWLVKMAVDDPDVQKRVASGELRQLSIGGSGRRIKV